MALGSLPLSGVLPKRQGMDGFILLRPELGWAHARAISDKDESCSALQPHASPTGGWQQNQLTESGRFVRDSLHTHHRSQVANACSAPNEDCRFNGCCSVPGHTCFQKNAEWATCRKSCSPNHPQHLTPWTCNTIVSHRSEIVVLSENQTGDASKGSANSNRGHWARTDHSLSWRRLDSRCLCCS